MFLLAHFNFHVSHSKLFHFSIYLQSKDTCMRDLIIFRDFCFKPLKLKYITPFPKLSENKQMKALCFFFLLLLLSSFFFFFFHVQIACNNTCILKLFFPALHIPKQYKLMWFRSAIKNSSLPSPQFPAKQYSSDRLILWIHDITL